MRRLTSDVAERVGLGDRGVIAPGCRADLNVIDLTALRLVGPVLDDEPDGSGVARPIWGAEGYRATIVAGVVTVEDGVLTGERPGRLVRGPQPSPTP